MKTRSRIEADFGAGETKVLNKVAPVDVFLAAYTDGNDKKSQRLVARVQGTKNFYFLFGSGVEASMKSAAPWLQKQLAEAIESASAPVVIDDVSMPVEPSE